MIPAPANTWNGPNLLKIYEPPRASAPEVFYCRSVIHGARGIYIFLEFTFALGMRILELNHVALHVADVERSAKFYAEVLRAEQLPRPSFTFPGAWFRLGTTQELHIIGDRKEEVRSHNRGNHFALRAEDLPSWLKHFSTLGIDVLGPKERPDRATQIFIRDPDGHVIELFTPARSEPGQSGS